MRQIPLTLPSSRRGEGEHGPAPQSYTPANSLILCGGATILRRDLKMRKEPYVEGRNARISGSGDRTSPQRHIQGEARERTRDHRPYGGTNAQEPYQGACWRQGSGRDDAL